MRSLTGAFKGCSDLTNITIPKGITSVGNDAFNHCSGLQYNKFDNGYYLGNEENPYLVLVEANGTSAINENTRVIYNNTRLSSKTIPSRVTSIGDNAFSFGTSYKYNEYDNAYYIGNEENPYLVLIKAKDTSITSCNINENTKFIHSYAFSYCTSLTSITIPDSVTSIGGYAFDGCKNLESITIGDMVRSIGDRAFYDCEDLTSVTIPNNVTSIGDWAFCSCDSLTSVVIEDGVTSIGEYAFCDCTSLISITIPESVTSIARAFSDCTSLTIYCEAESQPNSWDSAWNYIGVEHGHCPVIWGY